MSSPLRVGVIGIGHLGKFHARIYNELAEAELVGICDTNPIRKNLADEYGVPFYEDPLALIGQVDAVSIATPTFTHYSVAKPYLEKGIHTLIEKPITLNLDEADELLEIAKKNHCALQVGHIERHNPGFKSLEQVAQNIRFFEIHRLGPFTGRINDCGVVLDLMIHDLDIVLNLVDSKVKKFDAVGISVLTPFEDIANVRIHFENGAVANLTASRLTPEKQRKIRIFQENAYVSLDYGSQEGKIFQKNGLEINQQKIDIESKEPLKEELSYFLSSIASGKSQGQPDIAARDALQLALEIVESIKEKQKFEEARLAEESSS